MPDCQMCWNDWPSLTETPFPELAGIAVCRNCSRSIKQMLAFCRSHDLVLIPQVGTNSGSSLLAPEDSADTRDEPPKSPTAKKPGK